MNPPSVLHSAMSKERKPFTYTPGGLDLSEIKSERMAQRLMRNAMNQGVPEKPINTVQSPPVLPSNAIPNFNCLPVQVFPAFNLPANPKSLLRTRSNPNAPKEQTNNEPKFCAHSTPTASITKGVDNRPINNNMDNSKQFSCYDVNAKPTEYSFWQPPNYENDANKNVPSQIKSYIESQNSTEQSKLIKNIFTIGKNNIITENSLSDVFQQHETNKDDLLNTNNEISPVLFKVSPLQENADNDYEKKEVKVVKKQINTEIEVDQNGDTEAEIVVKLPSKKSAAKTETSVDILKKILPNGTVEEVKTTTTKTTIDGRTEITTKTETKTVPKAIANSEEIEEEQDEETEEIMETNGQEEENNHEAEQPLVSSEEDKVEESRELSKQQNGHIIIEEEKTEQNTVKKVVVSNTAEQESEEEIEEVEEEEEGDEEDVNVEQVVILKKISKTKSDESKIKNENEIVSEENNNTEKEVKEQEEVEEDEEVLENEEIVEEEELENDEDQEEKPDEQEAQEIETEDIEEKEGTQDKVKSEYDSKQKSDDNAEEENIEVEENQEEIRQDKKSVKSENDDIKVIQEDENKEEVQRNDESMELGQNISEEKVVSNESNLKQPESKNASEKHERKEEIIIKTSLEYEPKVGFLREPSLPLEKVEDVEIKPIGPAQEIFKKSHTEIITTTTDKPIGASTQTEFNRVENIVTVNRTSKILDHAYEQIAQPALPTLNTYFTQSNDRVLSSPQPLTRPYQPVFPSESLTERRHSLLLERLSMERQIPASDNHNSYPSSQNREQSPWLQEPQSEVLTVSNVKPSEITKNQQWYQHTRKEDVISSTLSPAAPIPTSEWNKPTLTSEWNKPQTQQYIQPQLQVQPPAQPQYQPFEQTQYAPKPDFTPSFSESSSHNKFNNYQNNTYPSYSPKPSWVNSTFEPKPTAGPPPEHYSTMKKESTESYLPSTQQLNSSYVPPPWEQDTSYASSNTNYYQPPPPTTSFTSTANSSWKPKPTSKFSKPAPTSYVPPAPNQSFVKPVTADDPPRLPGRKTYYSEYERRYISVPESTYVPIESKFQAQPDPSPQYYYDNIEPKEEVEPQWRRELREFTEKTQTTQAETSVRPPWEDDSKYAAPTDYIAPAPTNFTQTLRPRSWRERSFEPEYATSKEWPRTNTLGRGRPQSSYVKSNVDTLPRQPRGVSVDRYNPNSYMSPSEHPPVQSQTMNPNIQPKTYHNPTVPAYHARASAEPREQPAYVQHRIHVDSRAPPVQSRSFKYLQWITGTED